LHPFRPKGATAIEYGLIAAGISIAIIVALTGAGVQPQHHVHVDQQLAQIVLLYSPRGSGRSRGVPEFTSLAGLCGAACVMLPARRQEGEMSAKSAEDIIIRAIHEAFVKYPEGDGALYLDYEWIAPEQSAHIAKVILLELAANGLRIARKEA
jgi:hypothetical protein